MRTLMLLLVSVLMTSTALAQRAVIVVIADSSEGKTLYLTRFRAPGLENDNIDSAVTRRGTAVVFRVAADPLRGYGLRESGSRWAFATFYLASGDSLVFQHDGSQDTMRFDRIGANQAYRDTSLRPRSQWDFYNKMGDRDWESMRAYVTYFRKQMVFSAKQLRVRYPEHPELANQLECDAIRWYYEPQMRYFYRYFGSSEKPDSIDRKHLNILDSLPWQDASLARGSVMDCLVSQWLNLAMWRWSVSRLDTAGQDWYEKEVELALSIPPPARDDAIVNALRNLSSGLTPEEAVLTGEHALARYKPLASDTAYLVACAKSVDAARLRLPGKQAPSFSLPDTSGQLINLSDLRGKIVYLDFWGTWCHPCLEELPALDTLEKKFEHDTTVAFVSIALESGDEEQSMEGWKKFVLDKELHGTQLYAEHQFHNETAIRYDIQGAPTFMLINRDGTFIDAAAPRPSSGKAEAAMRAAIALSPK